MAPAPSIITRPPCWSVRHSSELGMGLLQPRELATPFFTILSHSIRGTCITRKGWGGVQLSTWPRRMLQAPHVPLPSLRLVTPPRRPRSYFLVGVLTSPGVCLSLYFSSSWHTIAFESERERERGRKQKTQEVACDEPDGNISMVSQLMGH